MRPLLISGVLLLGGCAHYHSQPIAPAANATRLENRSLSSPALRTFIEKNAGREVTPWPPAAWDFDLLALAAFYYHPSLEVARAQLAVAQGGETTAAQRPNPVLTATPGYSTTTSIPSPWLPLTFLDIPIETAGKRAYRRAEASHRTEAARLNLATVAWQVRADVRSSMIDLRTATQREALLLTQINF